MGVDSADFARPATHAAKLVSGKLFCFAGISGPLVIFLDLSESPCIFDICEQVGVLVRALASPHTTRLTVDFPRGCDGKQIPGSFLSFIFGQFVCQARFRICFWGCFFRFLFLCAFLVRFF